MLNLDGKTKDNIKSRFDLELMKIRPELHAPPTGDGKFLFHPACFCKLEMIFPPSFFDVMLHLPIHLAQEAITGGPVQYRWMYPIERFLRRLKSFVKNKARPEGSIAEAYILQECVNFCSMYLN